MANTSLPALSLLTDPGYLYWAPLGTSIPTNVIAASKFTDVWTTPWVPLGATDSGTDFNATTTVQPIMVAELLDAVAYRATDRNGNFTFALAGITAANLKAAFNGATTVVTGTGATSLTVLTPPALGSEVRAMIGWESLDNSIRIIAPQVFNSGDVKLSFNKAPAKTTIPWTGNFEVPFGGSPWSSYLAGTVATGGRG